MKYTRLVVMTLPLLSTSMFCAGALCAEGHTQYDWHKQGDNVQVSFNKDYFTGKGFRVKHRSMIVERKYSESVSLITQLKASKQKVEDCGQNYNQSAMSIEVIPQWQIQSQVKVGLGIRHQAKTEVQFASGQNIQLTNGSGLVLNADVALDNKYESLQFKLSTNRYQGSKDSVYGRDKGWSDNTLYVGYSLRF